MQYGISCMTLAFMVMFFSGFSSSVFVSWLCMDSHSAMISCGTGLCSILMLLTLYYYTSDGCIIIFFVGSVISFICLFRILPPAVCGLLSH